MLYLVCVLFLSSQIYVSMPRSSPPLPVPQIKQPIKSTPPAALLFSSLFWNLGLARPLTRRVDVKRITVRVAVPTGLPFIRYTNNIHTQQQDTTNNWDNQKERNN